MQRMNKIEKIVPIKDIIRSITSSTPQRKKEIS